VGEFLQQVLDVFINELADVAFVGHASQLRGEHGAHAFQGHAEGDAGIGYGSAHFLRLHQGAAALHQFDFGQLRVGRFAAGPGGLVIGALVRDGLAFPLAGVGSCFDAGNGGGYQHALAVLGHHQPAGLLEGSDAAAPNAYALGEVSLGEGFLECHRPALLSASRRLS